MERVVARVAHHVLTLVGRAVERLSNILWLASLHCVLGAAEAGGAVLANGGSVFVLVLSSGCVVTGHRDRGVLVGRGGTLGTSDA